MESKNTSRKKKVALIVSMATAGAIAMTASFAWLTSKDSITNEMSTDGVLKTGIIEEFTPPNDWTPGQGIKKDITVTNTGKVDAFVRVKLGEKITTNVEGEVATPATGTPYLYTDEQIAKYPLTIENKAGSTIIPTGVTVKMNAKKGYIAYVTATKQKTNIKGIAFEKDADKYYATVKGNLAVTYSTLTTTTTPATGNTTFTNTNAIAPSYSTATSVAGIKLTADDVTLLDKYANATKDNLYVSSLKDGTPIVLVLADDYKDNWDYTSDGYWYYKRILPVDETTGSLVTNVLLLTQANNDWANANYKLTVEQEGLQASTAALNGQWGFSLASPAVKGTATIDTTGAITAQQ